MCLKLTKCVTIEYSFNKIFWLSAYPYNDLVICKDSHDYLVLPIVIIQWNNIDAPDDHKQFKSLLRSLDLHMGGYTYIMY